MAKPHLDVTNREIQLKRSWPAGTSAMPMVAPQACRAGNEGASTHTDSFMYNAFGVF